MQETTISIQHYTDTFLEHIVNGLPKFLGALAILLIGYLIAKGIGAATRRLLNRAHFNKHLHAGHGGNIIQRAVPDPAGLIGSIVYWLIYFFAISLAVSVLGIPALVEFVRAIYAYLPNVLAALLIFLAAGAISAAVSKLVSNTMGDTPTSKVIAAAVPLVVMGIASFMILNQLQIAPEIVTITYAAIMGSTALGLALAFGLGGRDVASRMLENLYTKSRAAGPRVASDVRQGSNEAKRQARRMSENM